MRALRKELCSGNAKLFSRRPIRGTCLSMIQRWQLTQRPRLRACRTTATITKPPKDTLSFVARPVSSMLRPQLARSALRASRVARPTATRTFATTPSRQAEVELTIDGKKVSIEAGSALIQACEKAGVTIPRYCYHEYVVAIGRDDGTANTT